MSDDTGTLSGETDSTLVEMAQRAPGDTRPFEELLRRHQGFVVANCRYITRSAADAEDSGRRYSSRLSSPCAASRHARSFGRGSDGSR